LRLLKLLLLVGLNCLVVLIRADSWWSLNWDAKSKSLLLHVVESWAKKPEEPTSVIPIAGVTTDYVSQPSSFLSLSLSPGQQIVSINSL
jgi:hypothetical protein